MNYKKIYYNLTKQDMIADYTEVHHKIPRCMGGTDDKSNLVKLTPEAHYVAHQLLVKMFPEHRGLIFAANMMGNTRQTNKSYGWLRRKHKGKPAHNKGKTVSIETRAKISANHKGNTGKTHSDETRAKISAAMKGKIPHNKGIPKSKELCPHCNKEVSKTNMTRWHGDKCKLRIIYG